MADREATEGSGRAAGSRWGALLANGAVAVAAVALVLLGLEFAFRLAPGLLLPAGTYGSGRLHPALGMNVHGGRLYYNKVRFLERTPNGEGFLDVDHERAKPPGVTRVGFFGDSFVESAQVPLEATFFRRLAGKTSEDGVEPLAFGMSGWGTLHALRAWQTFAKPYQLDRAVYVFVENDLGDQAWEIARHFKSRASMPYGRLIDEPPGFAIEWFRSGGGGPAWFRAAKWLQAHSLLAQVVIHRVTTLQTQGVRVEATRDAAEMAERADAIPGANDLPSSWPPDYAELAETLGERVLEAWKAEADAAGIGLTVLYVPRSESQLRGELPVEDTWRPWLGRTCAALGIDLVDPSDALAARLAGGERVYDDHWTPAGHEVIAEVLAARLAERAAVGGPRDETRDAAVRGEQRPAVPPDPGRPDAKAGREGGSGS